MEDERTTSPDELEPALTTDEAVDHLKTKHKLEYSAAVLDRKARAEEVPSHTVGRNRRYRASLLDLWALGLDWKTAPTG